MVHLNGRARPEVAYSPEATSSLPSNLYDDLQSVNQRQERGATPRRSRSTSNTRGPKPLLPRSLKEALQLAELLAKSKLIPKGFETPETCLVGILYGMEVGLSPIAALQRMAVIDGRPTIWGDAALALVQASGLLTSIHEEIIEDPQAKILTAICTVRREGRSEPTIGSFSVEDAKRAGLWQKPGPWTDYPKRMITMRARAFALRDAFPDVLAGLYIREEFVGAERRYDHQAPSASGQSSRRDRAEENIEWNAAGANDASGSQSEAHPNQDLSLNSDTLSLQIQTITSGYDFGTNRHEVLHAEDAQLNSAQWSQHPSRRRAPPPPPEEERLKEAIKPDREASIGETAVTGQCSPDASLPTEETIGVINSATPNSLNKQPPIDDDPLEVIDPDVLMDLLDTALCCALDLPTFDEIVDDFADRLKVLSKDQQRQTKKIIDRHKTRVEELDRADETIPTEPERVDTSDEPELPQGLRSLLPSLGIGGVVQSARRKRRNERPSRSLSSWNARYHLNEKKLGEPNRSDQETVSVDDQAEDEE